MPAHRIRLTAFFNNLISSVNVYIPFLAVQQRFGRIDVVNVGRSTNDGVDQTRPDSTSAPMSGSGDAFLRRRPLKEPDV